MPRFTRWRRARRLRTLRRLLDDREHIAWAKSLVLR